MKGVSILLLTMLLFCVEYSRAQKVRCQTLNPLPHDAFDKMIVQDITYAITGEQTPVSGIKIDVSKPEATVSGVFKGPKKWGGLIGFEFKGGVTDKNFSLFKGNGSANSAFECRPSYYFIPAWSSAKYGECPEAAFNTVIIDAKKKLVRKHAEALQDTFQTYTLIQNYHLDAVYQSTNTTVVWPILRDTPSVKKILIHLTKKITKDEGLTATDADDIETILFPLKQASYHGPELNTGDYYDDLWEATKKYEKLNKTINEDTLNKMIINASEVWTKKSYYWINISPFIRSEKINEYYTQYKGQDSLYFKPEHQVYGGVSVLGNMYFLYPNRFAHLIRAGVSASRTNNLSSLSSFNYETRTPFFTNGNSVTEKTKTGTAYNHEDIKNGTLGQVNIEYYFLPLNTLIPGFYLSTSVNTSKLYRLEKIINRQNDRTQLPFESGMIFNVNSREKDKEKTILSLLFYTRNEDVTDRMRTPIKTGEREPREDYLKRNLSFGIRVGVPINLPQRAK